MTAAAPVAIPRSVLSFDEETHTYSASGRVVPSVTQVIKAAFGDLVWPWANEFALERGSKVHKALHYWILGDLDALDGHGLNREIAEAVADILVRIILRVDAGFRFPFGCDWSGH